MCAVPDGAPISNLFYLVMILAASERTMQKDRHLHRKAWAWPRSGATWFNTDAQADWFSDQMFVDIYHCHKLTFRYLVREIGPHVERQITNWRDPVPVETVLAIAIDRLATGSSYRSLARSYGVAFSTCRHAHGKFRHFTRMFENEYFMNHGETYRPMIRSIIHITYNSSRYSSGGGSDQHAPRFEVYLLAN